MRLRPSKAKPASIAAATSRRISQPAALMVRREARRPAASRFVPEPGRVRRRRGIEQRIALAAEESRQRDHSSSLLPGRELP